MSTHTRRVKVNHENAVDNLRWFSSEAGNGDWIFLEIDRLELRVKS